jgi:uridine kinase
MFAINRNEILKIKKTLDRYENIRWIIGGSCSGKTTLCRSLSKDKKISIYDMDKHIFGEYMERYTKKDHPANKAWFSAKNPLDWALSLPLKDFSNLNKAVNVEYLKLFSEDMAAIKSGRIIIVDGGITYPSVLSKVISTKNIVCLRVPIKESKRIWETVESKRSMKEMISKLSNPLKKWQKFLKLNELTTKTILSESEDSGIKVVDRDALSVKKLAKMIFISV